MTSKRGFRASEGEAPRYPTHDAFDRRGFLTRFGLGLLAAGAGCIDREVPPRGDFRPAREWRCCDGLPRQPDAAADYPPPQDSAGLGPDLPAPLDGKTPPDGPRDGGLHDTAATPDHPLTPHDVGLHDTAGMPDHPTPDHLHVMDGLPPFPDAPRDLAHDKPAKLDTPSAPADGGSGE